MFAIRTDRGALLASASANTSLPAQAKAKLAVPMGATAAQMKAIGVGHAAKAEKKPSLYKLTNEQTAKVLGDTTLAKQTDIYHVRTGETSLKKSFEAAIQMIGQQQAGDPESSISLNVDALKPVSKEDAIAAIMKGTDESQGDNNQMYSRKEVGALMHYLEAVSAPGAKIYMARWDDISSEYIGNMIAVQNPKNKELTFAQVIGFLP